MTDAAGELIVSFVLTSVRWIAVTRGTIPRLLRVATGCTATGEFVIYQIGHCPTDLNEAAIDVQIMLIPFVA